MRAPAGDGGKTGVPAEAADHGEAGPQGCADLSLRLPLRGRQEEETGGLPSWGGGLGCRELWERARQDRMLYHVGM